jgi:ribosomal protein S18 acetylase RimI-like enzyme
MADRWDADLPEQGRISMSFTIRRASAKDLPALEWYGLHTPHREIIASAFAMQESGDGASILADVNGFPGGQICIDFVRKRKSGKATLWALRVFPPLQRAGLGLRLMAAAERCILTRGITEVELGVDRDNAGVLSFYERLGYAVHGTEKGRYSFYTPDGELVRMPIDQWILRKRLAPVGDLRATS